VPTSYFFTFGSYAAQFSPGEVAKIQVQVHEGDWEFTEHLVTHWLPRVHEEATAPDLWDSVGKPTTLAVASSSPDLDNRPFTATERSQTSEALHRIEARLLVAQEFQATEVIVIREGFRHLEEVTDRIGRKDWLLLFIGQLVSLFFSLALSGPDSQQILDFAGNAMQFLWISAQSYLPN
jgi:hypothetical protein